MKTEQRTGLRFLAAAFLVAASGEASAQSFGIYSMPSRVTQYLGYGYGPGHHAPIVRTPGQHPTRVPRHARVPVACGPLYAAPVAPIGCSGESCYPAAGPNYAPGPATAPMPAVAPVDDRHARRFPPP